VADFCVGGAAGSLPALQAGDGGSSPTPTLHFSPKDLVVRPIPHSVAAQVARDRHYLHSAPASPLLSFGVFAGPRLEGIAIITPGPLNGHRLLRDADRRDVVCLARLWLSDDLPRLGESRVLGILARLVRRALSAKALLAYSDPAAGHTGMVYRAAGWLYLGHAEAQPLMRIGRGPPRHLRTIGSLLGTHSSAYLRSRGFEVEMVPTIPKLRYLKLLDESWRSRLAIDPAPYPKAGGDPP
jgi:hypothetical protein